MDSVERKETRPGDMTHLDVPLYLVDGDSEDEIYFIVPRLGRLILTQTHDRWKGEGK
jgi:hypothetical protein